MKSFVFRVWIVSDYNLFHFIVCLRDFYQALALCEVFFCTACRHLLPYFSPFKSLFQKYVNFKSENLKHPSREREFIFCFEDVGFRFRFWRLLDCYIFSVWISGRMDVLFEKW